MLVRDFIRETGEDCNTTLRYQHLPFEKLVEAMEVAQDRSRHPIYQALFDVQSFGRDFHDSAAPLWIEGNALGVQHRRQARPQHLHQRRRRAPGPCSSTTRPASSAPRRSRASARTYAELLRQFAALAHDGSALWHRKLSHLGYLRAERYREIVEEANAPTLASESRSTICEVFEQQVEARGDSPAVLARRDAPQLRRAESPRQSPRPPPARVGAGVADRRAGGAVPGAQRRPR